MIDHKYDPEKLGVSALGDSEEQIQARCRECGLPEIAHGELADHPEEKRLRDAEVKAATTVASLARKASRALREHRRVDAVVLLTQLVVTTDNLRKGQVVAINDQMEATRDG